VAAARRPVPHFWKRHQCGKDKELPANDTTSLAGRKEWLGLAVLCLPTMLATMDLNVVILALPRLSAALHASGTQSLWITDIYGFLISGFLVTMGRLGDRIGHRRLLLIGAAAFGALSVIAAYSTGAGMLIFIRALLGIAGATIMPSTLALLKRMFPDRGQMATAMGVWSMATMAGISLGPTFGGLLLSAFWWGSVFLVSVPVMLLLLAAGPVFLPAARPGASGRLDFVSVAMSLAAILPVIYGLKELAKAGWAPIPVLAIVLGLGFGVAFVRRQRGADDPLLDMRLFRIAAVSGVLVVYLLAGGVLGGNGMLMTQHLQLVEGFTPLRTALWLLLPSFVVVIGIQISMQLSKRIRPAWVLIGGMIVAATGMTVLTQVPAGGGLITLMVGLCVVFFGTSPVLVLSNQLVMQAAPPDRAGSVGSLSTTAGDLGTALGLAGVGSLITFFYRGNVAVPQQVPADLGAAANDSIAGATAATQQLPPPLAESLLTAARETFNAAYNSIAVVCAVLFLALGAVVFLTLRRVPPTGDAPPPEPQVPGQSASAGARNQAVGAAG
jgi:DHA2 family multidrug resistance protein-like MFS transporter